MKPLPPLSELHDAFMLDAHAGVLYWRKSGKAAVAERGRGYLHARLNGRLLYTHRIVYALHHGEDPYPLQIDHINGDRRDNRPSNLRLATNTENLQNRRGLSSNNTSGYRGVYWSRAAKKWVASIRVNRKNHHLGCFIELEDAAAARKKAERVFNFRGV